MLKINNLILIWDKMFLARYGIIIDKSYRIKKSTLNNSLNNSESQYQVVYAYSRDKLQSWNRNRFHQKVWRKGIRWVATVPWSGVTYRVRANFG